jgi:hypothetical protein
MRRDARLYHFPLAHAFPSYQHSSYARLHGELIGAPPAMKLIAYYVVFVLIGETIAYFIGRSVEHWSAPASLPVFLACFFIVFWGAWRLAIRVT